MRPAEIGREAVTSENETGQTGGSDGFAPAAGEREKILAAAGWEHDARRRPVLRELLRVRIPEIYFYCYDDSRHRATALDRARRIVMTAARTLEVIPQGCPLATWCFFLLEEERANPIAQPDLWRATLLAADRMREEDGSEGTARLRGGHRPGEDPRVRTLAALYLKYLELPGDQDLHDRADWKTAREDLECFLDAQFGEEPCGDRGNGPGWRQAIPGGIWKRSRLIAFGVTLIALVLVLLIWRSWDGLGRNLVPGKSENATASNGESAAREGEWAGTAAAGRVPVDSRPTPPQISGAASSFDGDLLSIRWGAVPGVGAYRVLLLSAKLDTLRVLAGLTQPWVQVDPGQVAGLKRPGSYLFQVDATNESGLSASTGLVPFELR